MTKYSRIPDETLDMWLLQEKAIVGAFLLAITVFGVLSFASYRTTQTLLDAEALVIHTHQVVETIDDLATDITAVESAARGFALTGDRTYRDDDSAARAQIEKEVQEFERLVADNPMQQQLLAELKIPLAEKLKLHEEMVSLRSHNDLAGTLKLMGTVQGRRLMEDIQQRIDHMQDVEK